MGRGENFQNTEAFTEISAGQWNFIISENLIWFQKKLSASDDRWRGGDCCSVLLFYSWKK